MLEKLGCRVDVAGDGREAVKMAARLPYGIVFMDLQMPEMDGLEATRAIREAERGSSRIPIVALTANAMASDRDRCLAAGMDDFIAKPVRPKDLAAALDRWVASADSRAGPAGAGTGDGDDEAWESRLLETLGGDPELAARIAQTWLDEGPAMVATLRRAVEEGDAPGVRDAAHRVKGGLLNLAGEAAASAAHAIERAGAGEDLAAASDALRTLSSEHDRLLARLARLVERAGRDGGGAGGTA
jgi:CheY-like chemotaxis protein/HPt (histidine-containing phosphotransfer) domain-containing protein